MTSDLEKYVVEANKSKIKITKNIKTQIRKSLGFVINLYFIEVKI